MAEYIEREANCSGCIHNGVCYMQEICNDIDEQLREFGCDDYKSAADVVEVVRCKDCIHRGRPQCGFWFDDNENKIQERWDYPDGFCGYGERKDEKR